jgi:hypothetical protein
MNRQSTAIEFRKRLFATFRVREITNLSACRFGLFKDSISPACIVTAEPEAPTAEPLCYMCPKPLRSCEDDYFFAIEPHDISWISPQEAAQDTEVWSALMWGGRRDLSLIRLLRGMNSLRRLEREKRVKKRGCMIRGDRGKQQRQLMGRRILDSEEVLGGAFLFLEASALPVNKDARTDRRASTDFSVFEPPQLILNQSWEAGGRFKAFMVVPDSTNRGIIPTLNYVTVHATEGAERELEAACLSHNSMLAIYFLFLTSGQCSTYRPKAIVQEVLAVPIPEARKGLLDGLKGYDDLDQRAKTAFGLSEVEWVLVEDLFQQTIPHFKGGMTHNGRDRTTGPGPSSEHLRDYCGFFRRVLKAGFGQDKRISATIFQGGKGTQLPVQLVAFYLDSPRDDDVSITQMEGSSLADRLGSLFDTCIATERRTGPGIGFRRTVRVYDTAVVEGQQVPTTYIAKPDEARYWTRSAAMRDADEVASDLLAWQARPRGRARSKGS